MKADVARQKAADAWTRAFALEIEASFKQQHLLPPPPPITAAARGTVPTANGGRTAAAPALGLAHAYGSLGGMLLYGGGRRRMAALAHGLLRTKTSSTPTERTCVYSSPRMALTVHSALSFRHAAA